MVINTLRHNYYVIHKLADDKDFETFLCSEQDSEASQRYSVARLKDKELTYKLITVFTELMKNSAFEDYYECFSKDGYLYLVFTHHAEPLLINKLKNERCELKERLEIGKRLLERVILLDMPDFILCDALADHNVMVSSSLEVQFNYILSDIGQFDKIGIREIGHRLWALYSHLFEYELSLEASADIKGFIDYLQGQQYQSIFNVYEKYEKLYEKLNGMNKLESIKPNTFLFRLWERIKGLAKYIKPVVSVIVVLLIAAYLIYTILHKKVDAALVSNFDRIGTVTIEEPDQQ